MKHTFSRSEAQSNGDGYAPRARTIPTPFEAAGS
jgi:hypothetical protein